MKILHEKIDVSFWVWIEEEEDWDIIFGAPMSVLLEKDDEIYLCLPSRNGEIFGGNGIFKVLYAYTMNFCEDSGLEEYPEQRFCQEVYVKHELNREDIPKYRIL